MLKHFYEKTPSDIVALTQRFLTEDFFAHFPELKEKTSLVIIGSVANGRYDVLSDIDVDVVCADAVARDRYHAGIKAYKRHIRDIGEPFQFHKARTFEELTARLADWTHDGDLRECARALIVNDPGGRYKKLQKRFSHYPSKVHKEKISWLFAEMVFQQKERLSVAAKRNDPYFSETVKLQIVRLLFNAVLIAHDRFPSFDKHLLSDAKGIAGVRPAFWRPIDAMLRSHDTKSIQRLTEKAIRQTEGLLLRRKLIPKRSATEWMDARPTYQVELG